MLVALQQHAAAWFLVWAPPELGGKAVPDEPDDVDWLVDGPWGKVAMLLLGGGVPFSQGWVRAVFGEDPLSALTDLLIHLGPGWIKVFSLSAFLDWLISRKLPRRNPIGEEFK